MGDLGFAEAYMYGEIDCEDLVKVFLVRGCLHFGFRARTLLSSDHANAGLLSEPGTAFHDRQLAVHPPCRQLARVGSHGAYTQHRYERKKKHKRTLRHQQCYVYG